MISTLDPDTISYVSDNMRSSLETGKYETLEMVIIVRLTELRDAQLHKLLTDVTLGDKRPFQLSRHV